MKIKREIFFVTFLLFMRGAYGVPTVTLNAPMALLYDGVANNPNHTYVYEPPTPYGAWVDGPMNPYRYGGHTYFQIPHSENFRVKIPYNYWGGRHTWTIEGNYAYGAAIDPPQRDLVEWHYNNRNWIFSVYAENGALYGLTHHEWYRQPITVGEVPGFNSGAPWIASIGWVKSVNGGTSWTMRPVTEGSSRLIAIPEPSDRTPQKKTFGFMHPSNVVKEGNYYYTFTSTANFSRDGQSEKRGVVLFRTANLTTPLGWEYWNGTGWTAVNHNTYQGNFGPQMPYVLWGRTNQCSHLYAMNVRKHKISGKWITLGSKYCLSDPQDKMPDGSWRFSAVFSWTNSLANPVDLETNLGQVQQNGASLLSNNYYSFFDVDGTADDNYQSVGDHPLLVVTKDHGVYYHQFLTLSGF